MMDHRALSPAETNEEDMDDGSPPSSPAEDFEQRIKPKKNRANKSLIVKEGKKKKRKEKPSTITTTSSTTTTIATTTPTTSLDDSKNNPNKKPRKIKKGGDQAQTMVHDQMRRALEEDQYSAVGSVVDTDSDEDLPVYHSRSGESLTLDRTTIVAAMRKRLWMERQSRTEQEEDEYDKEHTSTGTTRKSSISKPSTKKKPKALESSAATTTEEFHEDVIDRDEGSIFGQTQGASNATWVECDKCKKWRRLRGVVDEKKLPSKWYCSMNKNDAERARCSAPEEEYETPNTPESAADARIRKHLRVWVRRLESNESYEARQPTMTRGKKRSSTTNCKEPYEWIRCCNPSCGKWRALLRVMDSKSLISACKDGEWYCVQNTWDEKMASCAAPQENLPAIGCPTWVMQDE